MGRGGHKLEAVLISRDVHLALVLNIGISELRGHVLIFLLLAHVVAKGLKDC